MDFISSPAEVEKLADQKWEENLHFRNWLRQQPPQDVADVVDKIGREVAAAIDCTQCGNCCRALTIVPTSEDLKRLARGLEMDPYMFRRKYLKRDHEGDWVFQQRPCPFLKNSKCSVYEHRPGTCRSYPHLEKEHMAGRGWYILNNTRVCPIVYNVYEELKRYWKSRDVGRDKNPAL